jgi:2-haloacid dehalogenase
LRNPEDAPQKDSSRIRMAGNSQPFSAIIFDFGGVLIDWSPYYLYRQFFDDDSAIARFLAEVDFAAWNRRQDEGRPFVEAVTELSDRFPQYAGPIRAYDQRWEESLGGPIQGTVDILYDLKRKGYLLYGLSNWSAEKFALTRPKYAFFSCFEDILVSGEVGLVKPDPSLYTLFLERIGRSAHECLYIDDSEENVRTAERLGFQPIWFQAQEQLKSELIQRGVL